uniref:Neur_chan_LBD domain-containing protein n=1 Tax=Rhabditophanes sp. KR3021 TaxID=114890 RepID=A0AC35TR79_9BILA
MFLAFEKFLLFFILLISIRKITSTGGLVKERQMTDEQRLLYYLMDGYEKAVRPVKNASHAVVVKLGMTLTNIFEVDEKNQVLTINVWLDQEWKDELLVWKPEDHGGITSIRLPSSHIWLPDILLYNRADDYNNELMPARAMVYFDGTIFWPVPSQIKSVCKIQVALFPFDSQYCSMKFGSWTYIQSQLDLFNRSENIDLSNYVASGEFELISVHQRRNIVSYACCVEKYPDLTFFIHIRRKTLYFVINVIFPCLMMSILTLLVFYLPCDSGQKLVLGITILLSFSVFVLAIAEQMPETSDSIPIIAIYLTTVMSLTSISVVMTVFVLNLHHRGSQNKQVGPRTRLWILVRLKKFLRMTSPIQHAEEFDNKKTGLAGLLSENKNFNIASFLFQNSHNMVDKDNGVNYEMLTNPPDQVRKVNASENDTSNRLLTALKDLLKKTEDEKKFQIVAGEWKMVAKIVDKLLFYIFLLLTCVITVLLLVVIPVIHYGMETNELQEHLYGLH